MTTSPRRLSRRKKLLFALATFAVVALVAELSLRLVAPQFLVVSHSWHQLHRSVDWNDHDLGLDRSTRFSIARADGAALWNFSARTNELALRCSSSDPGDTIPAAAGRTIAHCIGDSFTFGWGVEFEESYPAVLQQLLGDRYQVLNLGDASFGLIAAMTKSDIVAKDYPPAVVIWQFDDSDFADDDETVRFRQRSWAGKRLHALRYSLCDQTYVACIPWALSLQFAYGGLESVDPGDASATQNDFAIVTALGDAAAQRLATMASPANVGAATLATLKSLHEACRAQHQRLVIVMQEVDGPEALVYQQAQADGIEVVVLPQLPKWLIPGDFHLNVEGNRWLARLVASKLSNDAR
jgi:lysophospholipase L1-like esterase